MEREQMLHGERSSPYSSDTRFEYHSGRYNVLSASSRLLTSCVGKPHLLHHLNHISTMSRKMDLSSWVVGPIGTNSNNLLFGPRIMGLNSWVGNNFFYHFCVMDFQPFIIKVERSLIIKLI